VKNIKIKDSVFNVIMFTSTAAAIYILASLIFGILITFNNGLIQ